jgi:lipopolysaccharide cholinephosphotransferase
MQLSDEDRRRLQLTELRVLVDVAQLCEEHGLRYALIGGTALGIRRHGGFIPWDDDIDVGMLRSDFDRFLEIARSSLPAHLYVQHWLDDPHMGAPFAKVRLNNTRFLEETSKHTGGHKGISIDIFPFDNVPRGLREYPWKLQLMFWKRLLRHKTGYTMRRLSIGRHMVDIPIRAAARLISVDAAKRRFQRLITRFKEQPSDRVLAVGGAYDFKKDMLKASWLSDLTRREFEDRSFLSPAQIDDYLTHMYGDFMTLPPVEQRQNKHTIVDLEFDLAEQAPTEAACSACAD